MRVWAGRRFVVAGRTVPPSGFQAFEHVGVPPDLVDLFLPLAESDFRIDMSSTQIREAAAAAMAAHPAAFSSSSPS